MGAKISLGEGDGDGGIGGKIEGRIPFSPVPTRGLLAGGALKRVGGTSRMWGRWGKAGEGGNGGNGGRAEERKSGRAEGKRRG